MYVSSWRQAAILFSSVFSNPPIFNSTLTATPSTAREFAKIMEVYCSFSGEAVNVHKSNILFGPKVPPDAKESILLALGHNDVKAFKYLGITMRTVNVHKSNILFGPKVPPDAKESISLALGHNDVKAFKYLGITMRIGKNRVIDFNWIRDQISCKIHCWGSRHLSMAGRVAFINSTLTAIPLHALENSPVPISIINKINSLLSQFLWSGVQSKHSVHYTSWDDVCTPKALGGLGIKNLLAWRRDVMGKIGAHVVGSDNSLLARTLSCKYSGPDLFKRNRSHSKMWKLFVWEVEL